MLDTAMRCFWERGYEATSVRDLASSMGITGASLYNAFGDKRSLYRRALDHYVEWSFVDRVGRFEALPPREAIGAFLAEIVERSLADARRKGCMLVNSALEMAPHDEEFRRVVAQVLVQAEAFFTCCARNGQDAGTIARTRGAEDIGRLMLSTLLGIRVLARVRPERDLLEGVVRSACAALDP